MVAVITCFNDRFIQTYINNEDSNIIKNKMKIECSVVIFSNYQAMDLEWLF